MLLTDINDLFPLHNGILGIFIIGIVNPNVIESLIFLLKNG